MVHPYKGVSVREEHIARTRDRLILVVGAPTATVNGILNAGLIRLYSRGTYDRDWMMCSTLKHPKPTTESYFGAVVKFIEHDSIIAVEAPGTGIKAAHEYHYDLESSQWICIK